MGILGSASFEELPEKEQEIIRNARENQRDFKAPKGQMPSQPRAVQ
jgi:hypothetical protein